ncbi:MAG: hypothetical protein ACE15C_05980 [Phycisphaerae bacterium]
MSDAEIFLCEHRHCPIRRFLLAVLLAAGLLIAVAAPAAACNIPVFRYALENWPSDAYDVVIFHKGPLSAADQGVVNWFEKIAPSSGTGANLVVRTVDVSTLTPPPPRPTEPSTQEAYWPVPEDDLWPLWQAQSKDPRAAGAERPWMVVRYPPSSRNPPVVWAGLLSAGEARALADSPKRQEVAKRILEGDAAVWVLLECGDKAKDDAAARLLADELKEMQNTLEISSPDQPPEGEAPPEVTPGAEGGAAMNPEKLRVTFSMVRLSRKDQAERGFIAMLLNIEKGLADIKEPIAFPVFGRGRVLGPLSGKGLVKSNIDDACAFLVGDCSCQVKEQNPGIDMLVFADWDAGLVGRLTKDKPLPPLMGLTDMTADPTGAPAANPPAMAVPGATPAGGVSAISGVVLVPVVLAALAVIVGAIVMVIVVAGRSRRA